MNGEAVIIAAIAAAGPLVAALAAWRQAKGTRAEVATNNGKRAGEYLEMLGSLSADVQIVKIESRLANMRLAKKLDRNHDQHTVQYQELERRLIEVEEALQDPPRGHIAL